MDRLEGVDGLVDQPHPRVVLEEFPLSLMLSMLEVWILLQFLRVFSTSVLEGLLVYLLTCLESGPLSLFGISLAPCVIPLPMLESMYYVSLIKSVDPQLHLLLFLVLLIP